MRYVENPPNPWNSTHVEWIGEPPEAAQEVFEEEATRTIITKNNSPDICRAPAVRRPIRRAWNSRDSAGSRRSASIIFIACFCYWQVRNITISARASTPNALPVLAVYNTKENPASALKGSHKETSLRADRVLRIDE